MIKTEITMMKRKVNKSGVVGDILIRLLLVIIVFVAALIFFASGIKETIFEDEQKSVDMKEASFPFIYMEVAGRDINLLHGYAANLDSRLIREAITPVTEERSITVHVVEDGSDVKKLKYEISTVEGREKENGSFTLLEDGAGEKSAKIDLRETYETGDEYILKITLVLGNSKRIYYYSRLKLYEKGRFEEKIDFIQNFHDTLLDPSGRRAEEVMDWLEPNRNSDHSSFATVNIRSRLNMVSYGELNPKTVYEQIPTVVEFYENYATVRIDYVLGVDTEQGTEYYRAEEHYRIGLDGTRTYLYNYERDMEEYFDIDGFSLEKGEFKLGIAKEDAVSTAISPNGKYMAFVYAGELVFYDIEENKAYRAFTFGGDERDFEREIYRNYDIKILGISDEGKMDFYVIGYMNSGEYEGRVGIILYSFDVKTGTREEKMYMPVNSSYEVLKCDFSDFAYLSEKQVFWFSMYDNLYAYNLASGRLETKAYEVEKDEMVFCEPEKYLAWVEADEAGRESLKIYHPDTDEEYSIEGPFGYIRLFGSINNNIIYGFEKEEDGLKKRDGTLDRPCYGIYIADGMGKNLKSYEVPDVYVSGIDIGENKVTINRVIKNESYGKYVPTESDTILNKPEDTADPVPVVKYVTDRMLTEYYVAVPSYTEVRTKPELSKVGNLVLNKETIARLAAPQKNDSCYYAYSFGRIVYSSKKASDVIKEAYNNVGTVINREGKLIWERGVKMPRSEIKDIPEVKAVNGLTSAQAAISMIALYRGENVDVSGFDPLKESIYEFMLKNMEPSIVDMTGSGLDEVLYCIYRRHPVIAINGRGEACVIVGYDAASVTVYEPAGGMKTKLSMSDAIKNFTKGGEIYIGFVD